MSLAKGARSKLAYMQEITYGVTPGSTPAFIGIPLRNETLGENINTVRSEEIRPDRASSAIRGGNIRTSGQVTNDFCLKRHLFWMKHLLGSADAAIATPVTAANATETFSAVGHGFYDGDPVLLGGTAAPAGLTLGHVYWVRDSADDTFKVAAYPGGPVAAFTTDGTAVSFRAMHVGDIIAPTALTDGLAVTRGTYYSLTISATAYVFLCRQGGTVTTAADLTQITSGLSQTVSGCIFQNVGTSLAIKLRRYTLNGGQSFPTPGLAIEKQILGGTDSLYILYRGCRLNTLELNIPQEGIIGATWSMVGLDVDPTKTAAFSSSQNTHSDDPATGFEAFVSINSGQTNRPIREASLSIGNSIDENVFCLGQRYRRDVPEGTRVLTGRFQK